jgi:hypothetical protein
MLPSVLRLKSVITVSGTWLLTVVSLLCIELLLSCVYFCYLVCIVLLYVCIAVLHTLVAGLLARSQYPEGPATGYLGTVFLGFPVSKNECWDGSQDSKLLLHASHAALST